MITIYKLRLVLQFDNLKIISLHDISSDFIFKFDNKKKSFSVKENIIMYMSLDFLQTSRKVNLGTLRVTKSSGKPHIKMCCEVCAVTLRRSMTTRTS